VYDDDGVFLKHVTHNKPRNTSNIKMASNGDIYFNDWISRRVFTYQADGTPSGEIGWQHKLWAPFDMALDEKRSLLFITDSEGDSVQVFKRSGEFDFSFGKEQNITPTGISINSLGEIGVTGIQPDGICVFNGEGKILRKFGSYGKGFGKMSCPYGICSNSANQWMVCDFLNERVQVLSSDGQFVTSFKTTGPQSICIDLYGRIFVGGTIDVKVFAFP
jgi:DNA-binding beta-propeller fold protein YncE